MNQTKDAMGVRLKWLGCACFEMDFGGVTVVNDPWITPNTKTELTWEAVEKCDYITLTHGHYDHTLDIPALVEKFDSRVLCGENTAIPLMRWADLNPMRVYPMSPNLELDFDGVKIKALYGRHTFLPGGANRRAEIWEQNKVNSGDPNLIELGNWGDFEYRNFLFTTPGGTKVLIWGNGLDRPDLYNTVRQINPDVFIMQMTTPCMVSDTARICAELGTKVLIPHHIDFPRDYSELVVNLGKELARVAPNTQYVVPKYGEWVSL